MAVIALADLRNSRRLLVNLFKWDESSYKKPMGQRKLQNLPMIAKEKLLKLHGSKIALGLGKKNTGQQWYGCDWCRGNLTSEPET